MHCCANFLLVLILSHFTACNLKDKIHPTTSEFCVLLHVQIQQYLTSVFGLCNSCPICLFLYSFSFLLFILVNHSLFSSLQIILALSFHGSWHLNIIICYAKTVSFSLRFRVLPFTSFEFISSSPIKR